MYEQTVWSQIRPRCYRKKIMLTSAEHDFFLLVNVKMPTIVGILPFISRKNSILGLSDPEEKAELSDIFILMII